MKKNVGRQARPRFFASRGVQESAPGGCSARGVCKLLARIAILDVLALFLPRLHQKCAQCSQLEHPHRSATRCPSRSSRLNSERVWSHIHASAASLPRPPVRTKGRRPQKILFARSKTITLKILTSRDSILRESQSPYVPFVVEGISRR